MPIVEIMVSPSFESNGGTMTTFSDRQGWLEHECACILRQVFRKAFLYNSKRE